MQLYSDTATSCAEVAEVPPEILYISPHSRPHSINNKKIELLSSQAAREGKYIFLLLLLDPALFSLLPPSCFLLLRHSFAKKGMKGDGIAMQRGGNRPVENPKST